MKYVFIILFNLMVGTCLAQTLEQQFVLQLQKIENSESKEKSKERGAALANYFDQSKQAVGSFEAIKKEASELLSLIIQYDAVAGMYTLLRIQNLEDAKQLRDALPPNQKTMMVNALAYHAKHYQDGTFMPGMPAKGTGEKGSWEYFYKQVIEPMIPVNGKEGPSPNAVATTKSNFNSSAKPATTTAASIEDKMNEAVRLFNKNEYTQAYNMLVELDKQQVAKAAGMLADYYYYGLGGKQINDSLAFYYARRSADGGYPYAMEMLAGFYTHGIGTKRDSELAVKYHKQALAQKYQLSLEIQQTAKDGLTKGEAMYKKAMATTDEQLKIQYLEQAADVYHLPAIRALTILNANKKFYDVQYYWAAVGAHLRDEESILELTVLELEYDIMLSVLGVQNSYNLAYLAYTVGVNYAVYNEDEEGALPWFLRAERLGNKDAYYYLGLIYNGKTKHRNVPLAKEYFKKAAQQGSKEAEDMLKMMQ